MTVRELMELNMMITDAEITVRVDGTSCLIDQLNIGCERGIKPRYPTQVPKEKRWIGNQSTSTKRDAHYIDKSINSWDDGKDYWQLKINRIPEKWLDLEVYSWGVWPASRCGNPRRDRNGNFHGQRINITTYPSGEKLEVKEPKQKQDQDEQLEGQMSIEDWEYEVMEI